MKSGQVSLGIAGRHLLSLGVTASACAEHEFGIIELKMRLGLTPFKSLDLSVGPRAVFDTAFRVRAELCVFEEDGWLLAGCVYSLSGDKAEEVRRLRHQWPMLRNAYENIDINGVNKFPLFAEQLNIKVPMKGMWDNMGMLLAARMGSPEEAMLREFVVGCAEGDYYLNGKLMAPSSGLKFVRISKMDRKIRAAHREEVKQFYERRLAEVTV